MRLLARILVAAAAGMAAVGPVAAGAQVATISSTSPIPIGYTLTGRHFVEITANLVFPLDGTCGQLANTSPNGFGFQLSLGPGTLSVFTTPGPGPYSAQCGAPDVQLTNAGNSVQMTNQTMEIHPGDKMTFSLVFMSSGTITATLTDHTQNVVATGGFTSSEPGAAAAAMTFQEIVRTPSCVGSCTYSPVFTNISVTDGAGDVGSLNGKWTTTANKYGGATPFMRNSGASFGVNLPGCPCTAATRNLDLLKK